MSKKEKIPIIKKFVDRMDYYGLLAAGAPSDEFDIESIEIAKRVCYDHSVQEIAEIIGSVFNRYFDEHNDTVAFLPVAEQIKNELLN